MIETVLATGCAESPVQTIAVASIFLAILAFMAFTIWICSR